MRRAICVPASLVLIVICGFVCFEPAWAGILPKLSISDVTVSDVSCSSQQAVFTVSVSAPFGKNATVQYATADGSAVAGTDYTAVSGILSFPKGSKASHTITVPIADVLIPGPNKTFVVNLSNPVNATLTKSTGAGTIVPPSVAKCQSCSLSCDDGDVCTTDACDAVRGCVHVNASTTATPYCQLAGGENGAACNASREWVDSDGDGFSDAAEAQGYIDVNANGVYDPGTDVLLTGADPHKPDVYLHYDYVYASDHDHNPPPQAIQWMIDAFAAHGVNLHIDSQHNAIDESSGLVVTLANPPDPVCAGSSAMSLAQLRQTYLPANYQLAYHYMVFGHYASCPDANHCSQCPSDPENPACIAPAQPPAVNNLGTAEIFGDDAIVATQPYADIGIPLTSIPVVQWGGLAMHELGHNLGLLHGGLDCYNNKPNYVSVMNYRDIQGIEVSATPGSATPISCTTDSDCATPAHCDTLNLVCSRLDYSDRTFNSPYLDETHLDENAGLQGGAGDTDISWIHVVKPTTGFVRVPTNGSPIDFNNDGFIGTGVIFDVNGDASANPLPGQNDWETSTDGNGNTYFTRLNFAYQCQPTFGNHSDQPTESPLGTSLSRTNFSQLIQHYWQIASRSQAAGSWTAAIVADPEKQTPLTSPQIDWLKERIR